VSFFGAEDEAEVNDLLANATNDRVYIPCVGACSLV
jgi:hypothetical protein